MNIFESKSFDSLDDLLIEQIEDLYDAERRLCKALPRMADAASDPKLREAFLDHLGETQGQIKRLQSAFEMLDREPTRDACDAMKGLIREGEEMIHAGGDRRVRDAALIAVAQRIEHYEIAGYGVVCSLAQSVGRDDIAGLLHDTLEEERAADESLTRLAESSVNREAAGVA